MKARKLRVFYSSDELEKAVSARTRLQAEISGKGESPFRGDLSLTEGISFTGSFSKENGASGFGTGSERKFPVKTAGKSSKPLPEKKDPRKIILETLEAAGGEMEAGKLREKVLEKSLNPEKFEKTLKTLKETGEVYSPARGKIKIV